MTFFSNITTLTVGVSLTLLSSASMADTTVSSNARLSNLQFQLIDLNPFDNVTPTINFTGSVNESSSTVQDRPDQDAVTDAKHETTIDYVGTGVSTAHSGAFANSSLYNSIATKGYLTQGGYFGANNTLFTNFTLSANTAFVLSGNISGNVYSISPASSIVESRAFLTIYGNTLPDNGGQQSASIDRAWNLDGNSGSFEHFSLAFANGNANPLEGQLFAQTQSIGYLPTTAVPEPESWAMMLGGLAALGVVARRRQRQKAQ
ncbi:MAG: hypothetical protein RL748_1515 [Pseudomonadota bacterium]|jgi:hypothetical protein